MLRNGTYKTQDGRTVKVTLTNDGYRIEDTKTREVTFVGAVKVR